MLLPRLAWEAVLLVATVAVAAILMLTTNRFSMGVPFWYQFATLGLLAAGFALSVRTGTPNLAIASIATLSGVVYAKLLQADWPLLLAGAVAVMLALLVGLVLGAITGLLNAPAWAVSLGGFAITSAIALAVADARGIPVIGLDRPGPFGAMLWSLLFVVVSVGGSLLFLRARVRTFLAGQRIVAALAGFTGSSVLAGLSGVVFVSYLGGAFATGDVSRLFFAVAAAILGGVSLAGTGVGGFAGTFLATALLVLLNTWANLAGLDQVWTFGLLPGLAILFGVLVSWVLELISAQLRPPAADASGSSAPAAP